MEKEELKKQIKSLNLKNKDEIAEALGVTRRQINRLLSGENKPTTTLLLLIKELKKS
jgi:transcriptional regulator with XRE-family HTH domain